MPRILHRERYLKLRRAGKTREQAARELGLDPFSGKVIRYEHWFKAEGGEAELRKQEKFKHD